MRILRYFIGAALLFCASVVWGKKVNFDVPPVLRFELDPLAWDLPYFMPFYYDAVSYQGSKMVTFKSVEFDLEVKVWVQYSKSPKNQWTSTPLSEYKPIQETPALNTFKAYSRKNPTNNDKNSIAWISERGPNFFVFLTTTSREAPERHMMHVKNLLDALTWVEPQAIDKVVGYPLDRSKLEQIREERKAIGARDQDNSSYYGYKPEAKIHDVKHGFSYAEYHRNQLQIAEEKVPNDLLIAYAVGIRGFAPWLLRDSVRIGSRSDYSLMGNYVTVSMTEHIAPSPFAPYTNGEILLQKGRVSVCQMKNGELSQTWVFHLLNNDSLKIYKCDLPVEKWAPKNNMYVSNNAAAAAENFTMAPDGERYIIYTNSPNRPTTNGLKHYANESHYLDLQQLEKGWIKMESYPDQQLWQLIMQQRSSTHPAYSIIEREDHYAYKNWDYDNKEAQIELLKERIKTPLEQILVSSALEKLDLNKDGKDELWQYWISNGRLLKSAGYQFTKEGVVQLSHEQFQTLLAAQQSVQQNLEKSKLGYDAFSTRHLKDFERNNDQTGPSAKENVKEEPPRAVFLYSTTSGEIDFVDNKKADALLKTSPLPASFKKNGKPIMVALEVQIDDNNRIKALPQQTAPSQALAPFYKEAQRLIPLLPAADMAPPVIEEMTAKPSAAVRTPEKIHIHFYFMPQ